MTPPPRRTVRAITGTVLEQNLFPVGAEYGSAAMVHEGMLYAYECGRPSDDLPPGTIVWPDDPAFSGCTVARVEPDSVGATSAWTYWTDEPSWSSVPSEAATMTIPGNPNGDQRLPVATLSVVDDPMFGFTMAYSPWPGFTDRIFVRSATSPTGPWTARTEILLPGCFDWANGSEQLCYAGTAQPWRSAPGQLGVGWYDQFAWTSPRPWRGSSPAPLRDVAPA